MITRLLAIVPASITIVVFGEHMLGKLLILSQVVLSIQLSFAVFPLVYFTSSRARMGAFVNSWTLTITAFAVALVIAAFNVWLLFLIAAPQQ